MMELSGGKACIFGQNLSLGWKEDTSEGDFAKQRP